MDDTQLKIVILDGFTLNPGDLNWDGFSKLGQVTVYDRTNPEEVALRIQGAQIVLTNKTPITEVVLNSEGAKSLRYIGVLATGHNIVDSRAAYKCGIVVTNIPSYGSDAVAQMAFAHLLEICHHVGDHSIAVKNGSWSQSPDWCFWNYPLIELAGKKLGIIGFGKIGARMAVIGAAFGMEIMVLDHKGLGEKSALPWQSVDEATLFAHADVISLHCPLTEKTQGMINRKSLAQMKDGVILINVSRGGLIVESDLVDALASGKVRAAGIDVVSYEPILPENPLLKAVNVFLTPHIAWAPFEARQRLMAYAVDNLERFLNNMPINVVNIY